MSCSQALASQLESSLSPCLNTPIPIFPKFDLADLGQSWRKGNLTIQKVDGVLISNTSAQYLNLFSQATVGKYGLGSLIQMLGTLFTQPTALKDDKASHYDYCLSFH